MTSLRGEAVVYVNYGRIDDFKRLENLGVSVSGKIALMRYAEYDLYFFKQNLWPIFPIIFYLDHRYGKIYRGNKIAHAAQFGAVAAILYSDPQDVARRGQTEQDVYPYSIWLPGGLSGIL